ncbi:MAG: transposase [Candidatus Uhrbacteria bacterium]
MAVPSIHRPCHDSMNVPGEYFITGKTVDGQKFIQAGERKYEFLDVVINLCERHAFELIAWMVADNHYHIKIYSDQVFKIGRFANSLHSITAKIFNDLDQKPGRKVWNQYWDRRIRDEKESWTVFNYIHWNPIKHRYAKDLLEATKYRYCSLGIWHELLGEELIEVFYEQYPIDQFKPFK